MSYDMYFLLHLSFPQPAYSISHLLDYFPHVLSDMVLSCGWLISQVGMGEHILLHHTSLDFSVCLTCLQNHTFGKRDDLDFLSFRKSAWFTLSNSSITPQTTTIQPLPSPYQTNVLHDDFLFFNTLGFGTAYSISFSYIMVTSPHQKKKKKLLNSILFLV